MISLSNSSKLVFLFSVCLAISSVILVFSKDDPSLKADAKLASYIFFKAKLGKVSSFKDESIMHGPTYFYFQTDDDGISRITQWLKLKPQVAIPPLFTELLSHAKSSVNWDFNWNTEQIYTVFYCNADGPDWGFDMLLVDGSKVVYSTSGFVSSYSKVTESLEFCN